MRQITVAAPAKLNLTLDILEMRPDGYHALDMLMQTVSLCDEVQITQETGAPWTLSCCTPEGTPVPDIPCDEKNLAWRAAETFFRAADMQGEGVHLRIVKRIPSQAGLAGGSADAAAVLRGLNALNGHPFHITDLCKLAEQCGSDVPFCVLGGTARVRGRGEVLEALPMETVQHYVIVKPAFGISTPHLFALSDHHPAAQHPDPAAMVAALRRSDPDTAGRLLCNVLEEVALPEHPEISEIRHDLLEVGACGARMTGSGSAVFGLFRDESAAKSACKLLTGKESSVFYAHSV